VLALGFVAFGALALAASTSTVSAQLVRWSRYTIPQTGTPVDFLPNRRGHHRRMSLRISFR
jgi:hypothetical protein